MNHRHSNRGFTFVELCLGLVVTSLVMAALASFSMAMASAWKSAEETQALTLRANQAVFRIEKEIRNARLVGACRLGSSDGSAAGAAVILWKVDTNNDGYIQGDECEMILHDTTNHSLILYPTGFADSAGTWSCSGTFSASTVLGQFPTNRTPKTMVHGVYGAVFETSNTTSTVNSPSLGFALKMMVDESSSSTSTVSGGGSQQIIANGTATVRAPIARPTN